MPAPNTVVDIEAMTRLKLSNEIEMLSGYGVGKAVVIATEFRLVAQMHRMELVRI